MRINLGMFPVLLESVFIFGPASDVQVLCEFLMDRFPGCFGFSGKHFVTEGGLPCLFPLRIEEIAYVLRFSLFSTAVWRLPGCFGFLGFPCFLQLCGGSQGGCAVPNCCQVGQGHVIKVIKPTDSVRMSGHIYLSSQRANDVFKTLRKRWGNVEPRTKCCGPNWN